MRKDLHSGGFQMVNNDILHSKKDEQIFLLVLCVI